MNTFTADMTVEEKSIYLLALKYTLEKNKSSEQVDFISELAKKTGVTKKELHELPKIKNTDELIKKIKKIPNVRKKRFILREIIMTAMADHEISDEEMQNIYKIGISIGIKEDKINDFFIWAAQGLEWQVEGINLVEKDF